MEGNSPVVSASQIARSTSLLILYSPRWNRHFWKPAQGQWNWRAFLDCTTECRPRIGVPARAAGPLEIIYDDERTLRSGYRAAVLAFLTTTPLISSGLPPLFHQATP